MVKLLLSLLATALVAITSAAPFEQLPFKSHSSNGCATAAKEFQSILLNSVSVDAFLSTRLGENILIGGSRGDKDFEPVKFCIVPHAASRCDDAPPSSLTDGPSCVKRGDLYRIRVEGKKMNGYITTEREFFVATPEFEEATPFIIDGNGEYVIDVRMGFFGPPLAWTVRGAGAPVFFESYRPDEDNQKFEVFVQYQNGIQREKGRL
ncbi:hypothetical protein BG004_002050 [Podila humilis]|nr:hypothetical protein BG004_002050 [Podila humilis]